MRLSLHLRELTAAHFRLFSMNEVRRARRDAAHNVLAHHNAQLIYCRINRINII